jgi:hypothetical protein
MATKKTAALKTAAKKPAAPAKKAAPAAKKAAAAPVAKPIKDTFNKSSLLAHLVTQTELDKKTVQTVLAHLENTIASAIHKKGAGEFTFRDCSRCRPSRCLRPRSASAGTPSLALINGSPRSRPR